MKKFILLFSALIFSLTAKADKTLENLENEAKRDFHIQPRAKNNETTFLIGKLQRQTLEIILYNDEDLSGGLLRDTLGIYPDTDDFGRTLGLNLRFLYAGDQGEIELNLENWLFALQGDRVEKPYDQYVEEDYILDLRTRIFRDQKGNQYVIFGVRSRIQKDDPSFLVALQDAVHSILPKTDPRISYGGGRTEISFNAMAGYGLNYTLLQGKSVKVKAIGEVEVHASTQFNDLSMIQGRLALEATWNTHLPLNPILKLRAYSEGEIYFNRELGSEIGLMMITGVQIKKYQIEFGPSIAIFDRPLDRQYEEQDVSVNTSLRVRIMRSNEKNEDNDYIFE